ncbi:hypothetical protein HGG75_07320 [Ochrobactrum pseudogrignonense]|nr:hypothetical protein [Brucella pseudogrignonensis]
MHYFYFLRASLASPQVSEIRAEAPCLCPTATFHNVTATDGRDWTPLVSAMGDWIRQVS